jgi:hypothetical protein
MSENDKQKRSKFRALARHDRITIASRFAEDLEQPFLPFDEFKQENRAAAVRSGSHHERRGVPVIEQLRELASVDWKP